MGMKDLRISGIVGLYPNIPTLLKLPYNMCGKSGYRG